MRYVLRFFVATLVLTSARDEVFVGETEQDVVKVIQATLECRHVPGMTVGIFKENDTWTRGFGTADLKSGRPVDEDTLFNIGSVTKSFTMALLAIMLKENKLQWTAKISDILGSEYGFIDDYRTRETTLRDLLSHRTGLASPDIGFMAGFPSSISREDLCKLHPAEPAGAILSSAEDMVRYFQFVLNNGNTTTGDQLTDPKLFSEAFSAAIPVNREKVTVSKPTFPISDVQVGYGSAWFESSYDGYRAVWHSGALWSYITLVWLFPETNIGIFISTNGGMFKDYQSKSLTTTMYFLADILLDKEPWLNSSTACSFPLPWKEVNETDPRLTEIPAFLPDISEYAGIYGNEFQPDFILTVSGSSQTQLNFESGIIGGNLYSTQDKERFLMEITYPWEFYVPLTDHNNVTTKTNVTFVREVGTVTSMILNFGTNITYTKDVSILDVISRNTNGSCRLFSAAWLIVYLLATCVVWLKYNQRI
ncbi:uncharacterized protein LOC128220368 isoform X3 [Mya arenaria]|uniref:uncharacterized protein LOC128220368 isoform X3 n=1 Tax=Mya arenaria TaxID=6604 RepID=UPI0022E37499|nr:uncharacterized protein LOC128220368 isoform X3 [Mya arenaria]